MFTSSQAAAHADANPSAGTVAQAAQPQTHKDSIKLAILALLVMLIVATPAVQVWKSYRFELKVLTQLRDTAEPLAITAAGQRALMAHKASAQALLQGQLEAADQLRADQAKVADYLSKLTQALALRQMDQALAEAQGATQDWLNLLTRLESKSLSTKDSAELHQLVMEQLLQVSDLLADSGRVSEGLGPDLTR